MPEVGCCILARPTKKMGLYRQMIGRVLRPAPGKPDAIILDHSGAVFRHGFAEDPVEWTLDPGSPRATSPTHNKRGEDGIGIAAARMHAMRRHPRRRRAVLSLRVPAAAPAARCCHRRRRAWPGRWHAAGSRPTSPIRRCARTGTPCSPTSPASAAIKPGLDCPQVQGKIRRLAAMGRDVAADPADAGSPQLGALAHDRLRQRPEVA